MTKDKKVNLLTGAILAAALAMTAAFPASAKEERTPVGHITLNFDADVQAGDVDASVSVSVEDGSCSVESADFVNEQEYCLQTVTAIFQNPEKQHLLLTGIK